MLKTQVFKARGMEFWHSHSYGETRSVGVSSPAAHSEMLDPLEINHGIPGPSSRKARQVLSSDLVREPKWRSSTPEEFRRRAKRIRAKNANGLPLYVDDPGLTKIARHSTSGLTASPSVMRRPTCRGNRILSGTDSSSCSSTLRLRPDAITTGPGVRHPGGQG